MSTVSILKEVRIERKRQDEKFGIQNLPINHVQTRVNLQHEYEMLLEDARWVNDTPGAPLSFESVLREEFLEFALADPRDIAHVREELIQVAAVAVKAVEAIDRRKERVNA